MKVNYIPIFVLIGLAILSGMPILSSGSGIVNSVNARYATNTQTQADSNECDTGTNCAITSPQTQGDGTANSPTNLQISKFNEDDGEGGVGGGPLCGTLIPKVCVALLFVTKEVICPTGFVCPSADKSVIRVEQEGSFPNSIVNTLIFPGSNFTLIEIHFPEVSLETPPGYNVSELITPPTPPGLVLEQHTSESCNSIIGRDNLAQTCIITNDYNVADE